MRNETKKIGLAEANKIFKAFDYSLYWLDAMVQQGYISESVAGRIIFNWRINQ